MPEREHEGTFRSDGHAPYLDRGLGDICILGQNLANAYLRVVLLPVNFISEKIYKKLMNSK